ncbi:MAG: aminotransferase class V-fold PLP-dependent enzyme, partial [Microthrixaceae bacterium]
PGDAVLLTQLEHHANIVPWQQLAADRGFEIRWIPLTEDAQLDLTELDRLLDGVKLLAVTAMSNVVGTITPVRRLADAAHAAGALVSVDACQYVPHVRTDVHELGADFLAFSGHKMLGPTGIGVLWGRKELLEAMPPFLGGGGMILDVRLDGFVPADVPHKFEAGTPPIAETVGLAAAIDYLDGLGMEAVRAHEISLTAYALRQLTERFGDRIDIYGPAEPDQRGGVMSFGFDGIHPHDLSQVLDQHGVCVRPGHHCAKPLMRVLGVGATARASWYVYNDESDVDALGDALDAAGDFFTF